MAKKKAAPKRSTPPKAGKRLIDVGIKAPPIIVGMTVRLASGGPLMTVEMVHDGYADCAWFVETDSSVIGEKAFAPCAERDVFHRDALEIIQ